MSRFGKDFLLGAATAAHQVEGNNIHSDDWAQEQMIHTSFAEPSGLACDHYHRFEEDIRLLAEAGLNAYRFSVEWARIEPEEGVFDEAEMEHYREVIACCRKYGVEPIVTLMHFTSPLWLIRRGGWESENTVAYFQRYAAHVAKELGKDLKYICTINEANMGLQLASIMERYMRMISGAEKKDGTENNLQVGINVDMMQESMRAAAAENMAVFGTAQPQVFVSARTVEGDQLVMRAHQAARAAIREICPHIKIGLTLSLHDIQAIPGGEANAQKAWDDEFAHYLPYIREDDFLGVQNYTRAQYGPEGELPVPHGAKRTQMDYENAPEALEQVLRKVHTCFPGELFITENGIATAVDEERIAFIETATRGVAACMADGLPIVGYLYWSLLDNFEWQKGYGMTFGLIGVDRRRNLERLPKKSLAFLGALRKETAENAQHRLE